MVIEAVATNRARLVRTRVAGLVLQPAAKLVVNPLGKAVMLPGQGGVVLGIGLGDLAGRWIGDHVEPGLSIGHPDPAANLALRRLCCVGNPITVLDGAAEGTRGVVTGKHGAVLALVAAGDLARMGPGDRVRIDAEGVGLAIDGEPELVLHSCAPSLLESWIRQRDTHGRLVVPVAVVLPAQAAAAGIGMPAAMFNMDLNTDQPPIESAARALRFGDIVAVADHDHRWGRRPAAGWTAIGVVSHGRAVGGGHGFGVMTLLSAPSARLSLVVSDAATLGRLIALPGRDRP